MRKIRCIACVMVLSMILGCGSSNRDSTQVEDTSNDTELSSIINDDSDELLRKSEGTVRLGFQSADKYEYTYSGTEMEVPLYVGMEDNSEDVEVAAILFLNGEVQPYSYELNGELSAKQMVHFFTLGPDEMINFTAHVTPISGEKGNVVGMQFATVFRSDYLPESEGNTSFGNCGKISATVSIPVNMKVDGVNKSKADLIKTEVTDIPEEIMSWIEGFVVNDTDNPLDYMSAMTIETDEQSNCLYSKDGKLHLTLQMYGGKEIIHKITFFINNQPVKVGDYDYVETRTTTDKMTVFEVDIDVSECEEISSLYAVAITAGEDYQIQDDTIQTENYLLINR